MKTITKRFLILFLAVMAMMVNANAKSVPYATLSGRTLTLEYGELPTGQYVYDMSNEKFYENWSPIVASIEKITIEPSFAEVRFKTCARLFCEMSSLKSIEGLRYLNTSEVTDMKMMFLGCAKLTDLDVSGFNTSQVTDMSAMFSGCSKLASLDLGSFNTSIVTNMSEMFRGCSSLTSLNVSGFNTSNVTDMTCMFTNCSSLTSLDVSSFNTLKVTNMMYMFAECSSLTSLDVSSFNTLKVTNMSFMFYKCSSLTSLDISSFNTSNVTDMTCMFSNCISLTSLDVSGFNTSNVTNMRYMFYDVRIITSLDVSSFNTSNVTNMSNMFWGCSKLTSLDLSSFNTSSVNDMSFMFAYCTNLATIELRSFNTSNVTNMYCMFYECKELTSLDLVNFNTSNVTDMRQMFYNCCSLTTIYCNDKWSCDNSSNMFASSRVLKGAISYSYSMTDVTYANPETGYFTYKDYDLWVNGTQVTHTNYNDLSGISGVSGTVKYDIYADALILDNATITATGNQESAIKSEMSNLRIHVEGSSTLTSATGSGIHSTGSLEFSGGNESSLLVNGTTAVLMMSDAENRLKVKDLNLTLDGTKYYGVLSFYSNTVMEIQSNSEVKTRGVGECYRNLNDIIIPDSCEITEPAGAYISGGKVYAADGNTTVKSEWVTIGPKGYDLWVGGVQVNVANCSNITGSNIKQGTATYDDETKTLTLTDCSIGMDYTTGTIGIKSSMDSLAIHLVGNNSIGMVDTGIECSRNLTIAGPGKLDMVLCGTGIAMTDNTYEAELAICDDAKLSMVLVGTGIVGAYVQKTAHIFYKKDLRISGGNSDVDIIASQSAVSDMNVLTLNDGITHMEPCATRTATWYRIKKSDSHILVT